MANGNVFIDSMSRPQSPLALLLLYVSMLVSISIHEFAHGATLMYFGERIRRIGIMLFYLSPAFFCDVTEAWKLPSNRQRTLVALAGVASTFGISGLAALLFLATGASHVFLALLAITLYAGSVMNLMPFIMLDGYIALMTFLDEPYLRDKVMREWKQALVLACGRNWEKLKGLEAWRILFGFACSATPLALLLWMAHHFVTIFGLTGRIISFALIWGVIFLLARGLVAIVKMALSENLRAYVGFLGAGAGIIILTFIGLLPLPQTQTGAYWISGKQTCTDLVSAQNIGKPVELYQAELFLSKPVGTGVISINTATVSPPLQSTSPSIKVSGAIPRQKARLIVLNSPSNLPEVGVVVMDLKTTTLATWIGDTATLGILPIS